jgi:two-component system cell cycle sensor histidine kinase/response regulator CckA
MPGSSGAAPPWAEVVERAPVGVGVVDLHGAIVWSNSAFRRLWPPATPEGATRAPGSPWEVLLGAARRAIDTGKPETVHDVRLDDGTAPPVRIVDLDVSPIGGPSGRPGRAAVFVRDSSSTYAERERARLFYTAFLTSNNAMEATDRRGVLVDVNPAFERIYGYHRDEVVGQRPNVVRSSYTPPEVYQDLWTSITDPKRGSWSGEILNRDKHGRERPVFLTITAVRDPAGAITNYLGVAVDLSERRAWEHQAAHGEKLASIGQLAAGVAHEINTPLANVMLVTESMRRRSTDPWMRSRLTTVTEQIEVAARIVRGLLDYARRNQPQVAALDLRDIVRDAAEFVEGKQPKEIDLKLALPEGPVPVQGDRNQLLQVLTNLLVNAFDAIPQGRGTVELGLHQSATSATIEVADSGSGIPEQVMPHIFEPFFTTKGEGKGTGLGLAICHGIVQAHHGAITAANRAGGGAVFRVVLPLRSGQSP